MSGKKYRCERFVEYVFGNRRAKQAHFGAQFGPT
jgi:hypothetical protein